MVTNKLAAALSWLLGKPEPIEKKKKRHEESSVNLKIKVTSGYFCGQEMLSYVVATKISHKLDFQNFSIFLVSKRGTTTLKILLFTLDLLS